MRPVTVTVSNASGGTQYSPFVRLDDWAPPNVSIQCNVTGTATYTIEMSNDDPNSPTNPVAVNSMAWRSDVSPIVSATASAQATMSIPFLFYRVTQTAGSGSVTATFVQFSSVPL
jgi:hypothetical protein